MTPRQLRAIIEESGLDKDRFAARLGVTVRTLYRWIGGDSPISTAFVALIEKRFPEAFKILN
jgi:DNA-binding transcriptional regulator YiaG